MGVIGDTYASVEDLEHRLNQPDTGMFAALLNAASRAVESFTGRQFNSAEEASPRRFRAVDPERLPVDDFYLTDDLYTTDDVIIEVNGVELTEDQYDLRPWNGIVDGQPGWPYFDVFRIGGYWPYSRRPNVEVTALWGWAAVPEGIRQATLDVATVMFYGLGGSASGPVRAEAIDGYSVSYQSLSMDASASSGQHIPQEMIKAAPYRRLRFGVA